MVTTPGELDARRPNKADRNRKHARRFTHAREALAPVRQKARHHVRVLAHGAKLELGLLRSRLRLRLLPLLLLLLLLVCPTVRRSIVSTFPRPHNSRPNPPLKPHGAHNTTYDEGGRVYGWHNKQNTPANDMSLVRGFFFLSRLFARSRSSALYRGGSTHTHTHTRHTLGQLAQAAVGGFGQAELGGGDPWPQGCHPVR